MAPLDDADKARVEIALKNDASLREELADVKSLSAMVADGGGEWEAARKPADEARLGRLMDRIAAEPKAQAARQAAPQETPARDQDRAGKARVFSHLCSSPHGNRPLLQWRWLRLRRALCYITVQGLLIIVTMVNS